MKKTYYFALFVLLFLVYFISDNYVFVSENNYLVQIRGIERMDQSPFTLKIKMSELFSMRDYAIIGGGLLNMPADYARVTSQNASLIIVHGTDYGMIKKFLQSEFNRNSNKTFIITALALKRILLEKSDQVFSTYLEHYKSSGDIFNDQGAPFYYMDQIQFHVKDNLEGIILSFPLGYYFSKVKNYGLAHLIESDFSIQGFENPIRFLEAINFPKPAKFEGSFEDLIKLARSEYHIKYLANIISIDQVNGLVVPKDLVPFLPPRKKDKTLPLFTVVKLSKNVYFSGLIRDN